MVAMYKKKADERPGATEPRPEWSVIKIDGCGVVVVNGSGAWG